MKTTKPKPTYQQLERRVKNLEKRIATVYDIAGDAMCTDGQGVYGHIDEIVRTLAGRKYQQVVREQKAGAHGPETYTWRGYENA